jgi:hypothetical protein
MLMTCGSNQKHEVIERTEKDVPNYYGPATRAEVESVLARDEYTIFASCDTTTSNVPDADRTCGFAALNTYECGLQTKSLRKEKMRLGDCSGSW